MGRLRLRFPAPTPQSGLSPRIQTPGRLDKLVQLPSLTWHRIFEISFTYPERLKQPSKQLIGGQSPRVASLLASLSPPFALGQDGCEMRVITLPKRLQIMNLIMACGTLYLRSDEGLVGFTHIPTAKASRRSQLGFWQP